MFSKTKDAGDVMYWEKRTGERMGREVDRSAYISVQEIIDKHKAEINKLKAIVAELTRAVYKEEQ